MSQLMHFYYTFLKFAHPDQASYNSLNISQRLPELRTHKGFSYYLCSSFACIFSCSSSQHCSSSSSLSHPTQQPCFPFLFRATLPAPPTFLSQFFGSEISIWCVGLSEPDRWEDVSIGQQKRFCSRLQSTNLPRIWSMKQTYDFLTTRPTPFKECLCEVTFRNKSWPVWHLLLP